MTASRLRWAIQLIIPLIVFVVRVQPSAAQNNTVTLFSNLGTYNVGSIYTAGYYPLGQTVSMPFTVAGSGNISVTQIDLGVASCNPVCGTNSGGVLTPPSSVLPASFSVSIWTNNSGAPGTQVAGASWDLSTSALPFTCCPLSSKTGISGVTLTGGAQYFMVLGPAGGTGGFAIWYFDSGEAAFDVLGTSAVTPIFVYPELGLEFPVSSLIGYNGGALCSNNYDSTTSGFALCNGSTSGLQLAPIAPPNANCAGDTTGSCAQSITAEPTAHTTTTTTFQITGSLADGAAIQGTILLDEVTGIVTAASITIGPPDSLIMSVVHFNGPVGGAAAGYSQPFWFVEITPATITYNYAGKNYTTFFGSPGVTTANSVSASLTFASPLPVNFSGDSGLPGSDAVLPVEWSITDGVHTFSSASGNQLNFLELGTNSSGAIDSWHVIGCSSSGCNNGDLITASNDPGDPGYAFDLYGFQYTGSSGSLAYVQNKPGTWAQTLNGVQGGQPAAPVFLFSGSPVASVSGTISGEGSGDYYLFYWPGGAFSATASVTGAASGASYLFSEGVVGTCNSSSVTLNDDDSFSGTISAGNLAAGQYCIGLLANSPNDPTFTLTFNTPVQGAIPCTLTVIPAPASLPPTGTSTVETCPNNSGQPNCGVAPEAPESFTVTPNASCGAWTATSSNPEFLRITSGATGSGIGTVSYVLLNNTHTLPQNYTITVASGSTTASYAVTEAGSGDSQTYRQVYALYEQLLGRDPDAAGFTFWTGAGGAVLGQMADSFLTSPEAFNSDFAVMAAYQAATNNPPTFAQYTAAVASIRSGQSLITLFNSLIGSNYSATSLYQNLLGRAPGPNDLTCINSGLSQCFETIIGYPGNTTPMSTPNNEFQSTGSFSTDHSNALYVRMVYYVTVSRDPDQAGLNFWLGVANSGGPGLLFQGTAGYSTRIQILGPGTVGQGFIGSPEFLGLFAN